MAELDRSEPRKFTGRNEITDLYKDIQSVLNSELQIKYKPNLILHKENKDEDHFSHLGVLRCFALWHSSQWNTHIHTLSLKHTFTQHTLLQPRYKQAFTNTHNAECVWCLWHGQSKVSVKCMFNVQMSRHDRTIPHLWKRERERMCVRLLPASSVHHEDC